MTGAVPIFLSYFRIPSKSPMTISFRFSKESPCKASNNNEHRCPTAEGLTDRR